MPSKALPIRLGWEHERPISRQECELRVLRALATQRCPGIVLATSQGIRSNMPSYVHDESDLKAQKELIEIDRVETFIPDRRDLSDWDTAFAWFCTLYPPRDRPKGWTPWTWNRTQRVINWRSYGLDDDTQPSFEWIAKEMKVTRDTIRRWYGDGIDTCWQAAQAWTPGRGAVTLERSW